MTIKIYPEYQFQLSSPKVGRLDERPTVLVIYNLMKGFSTEKYHIPQGVQQIKDFRFIDDKAGQVIQYISDNLLSPGREEKLFLNGIKDDELYTENLSGDIEKYAKGLERTLFSDIFLDFRNAQIDRLKQQLNDAQVRTLELREELFSKVGEEKDFSEINKMDLLSLGLAVSTGFFGAYFVKDKFGPQLVSLYTEYLKEFVDKVYNLF